MIKINNLTIPLPHGRMITVKELSVPPAGLHLITGDNGCGKSTLARALLSLTKKYTGIITVDGRDSREFSRREMAGRIAYLPQHSGTVSDIRVMDFISEGLYCGRESRLDTIVKELELVNFLERSLARLSGGERQLCRIARTLAARTPYAIMDEPDTYLSRRNKKLLADTLRLAAAETGIILVSHEENAFADSAQVLIDFYDPGSLSLMENAQPQ